MHKYSPREYQDTTANFRVLLKGDSRDTSSASRFKVETSVSHTQLSLAKLKRQVLSLDYLSESQEAVKRLREIAKGFLRSSAEILDEDAYTSQLCLNRGWKLLYLGLLQKEPIKRYIAMKCVNQALPTMRESLLDSTTREVRQTFMQLTSRICYLSCLAFQALTKGLRTV